MSQNIENGEHSLQVNTKNNMPENSVEMSLLRNANGNASIMEESVALSSVHNEDARDESQNIRDGVQSAYPSTHPINQLEEIGTMKTLETPNPAIG